MTAPMDRAGVVRVMTQRMPTYLYGLAREHALAQLADMEAAGLRVVPVVLTQQQKARVRDNGGETAVAWATAAWPDLLAASPFAPPQQGSGT